MARKIRIGNAGSLRRLCLYHRLQCKRSSLWKITLEDVENIISDRTLSSTESLKLLSAVSEDVDFILREMSFLGMTN